MRDQLSLLRTAIITENLGELREATLELLGNDYTYRLVHAAARYKSFDRAYLFFNQMLPDHIVHDMDNNSRRMGWSCVIAGMKTGVYSTSHEHTEDMFITHPAKALLLASINALIKYNEA